jgi:hypothetical protein
MEKALKIYTIGEAEAYRQAMRRVLQICDRTEDYLKASGSVVSINGVSLIRAAVQDEIKESE